MWCTVYFYELCTQLRLTSVFKELKMRCVCFLQQHQCVQKQTKQNQIDQNGLFYGLALISSRPPRCIALEGHPK